MSAEWSVLDSALPLEWVDRIGLRLPRIKLAVICPARNVHRRFGCTRAEGHTGRHAATGAGNRVLAVWL